MERLLQRLKDLQDSKKIVEEHGPASEQGQAWLADVVSCLEQVAPELATEFSRLMAMAVMPLSSGVLGPVWLKMQATISQAIGRVESATQFSGHQMAAPQLKSELDIFISHSAKDREIADSLVELLRSAMSLDPEKIRCTSVDGCRLPLGAQTENQLRAEILGAKTFIGLITEHSIRSPYVLFELGARWGANQSISPLVAGRAEMELLKGPLSAINALDCRKPSEAQQLLVDIAQQLEKRTASPAAYQKCIDALVMAADRRQDRQIPKTDLEICKAEYGAGEHTFDVTRAVVKALSDER